MKQIHEPPQLKYKYSYELLLLALFLALYIIPLGARPLMVPDETRYAEIPREMLASGNWVSPHLNGMRYFEKPVLGYWLHAVSLSLFGENNFAVRLPAALSVGLSALLLYLLFKRLQFAEKRDDETPESIPSAILTPLIFLTSAEVFGVGNTAVLDNPLALFLTATIISFFLATEAPPGSIREKKFLLLAGAFCGLAFLTKGFLAFAVPVLSLGAYLIWQRRYRDLWRMSWLPLLTAVIVALPWSILIHLREPDFWNFFFWNEHVRRFISVTAQHKKPFYFYLLTTPYLILPWTLITVPALAGLRTHFRQPDLCGRLLRLAVCWLVLPFLFFSAAEGKISTYILPCFPPFAMLMAIGLNKALENESYKRYLQWGIFGNLLLFIVLLLALILLQTFSFQGFRPYRHLSQTGLLATALIFAIGFSWGALRSRIKSKKLLLLALAPCLMFSSASFLLPDLILEKKAPGIVLQSYYKECTPETIIVAGKKTVRAVCWYLKRNDVYLLGGGGELKYGLSYKKSRHRLLDLKSASELIAQNPGRVIICARVKTLKEWSSRLPTPILRIEKGSQGYGIWKF